MVGFICFFIILILYLLLGEGCQCFLIIMILSFIVALLTLSSFLATFLTLILILVFILNNIFIQELEIRRVYSMRACTVLMMLLFWRGFLRRENIVIKNIQNGFKPILVEWCIEFVCGWTEHDLELDPSSTIKAEICKEII